MVQHSRGFDNSAECQCLIVIAADPKVGCDVYLGLCTLHHIGVALSTSLFFFWLFLTLLRGKPKGPHCKEDTAHSEER